MKEISVIRDRGQLTIPDSIRKKVNWAAPNSVVSISVIKPDEILIKPNRNYVDWDKIWENIRKSRASLGKGHESSDSFLEKDRMSH